MADGTPIITDGSIDFSGGVNSIAVTTVQSDRNPNGLQRNQLAWLDNATVRDGGITCRSGWQKKGTINSDETAFYQGKFMYQPIGADPYFIHVIGGHVYRVDPDTAVAIDLTAAFPAMVPQFNPNVETQAFFVQGEKYLVIQAGDGVTPALFWDGVTLRRSIGITNTAVAPGTPGVNEIPPATAMDYFMGRIWYAQDRTASAGDIVKGPSGTLANDFTDSILNVTENPMVLGGDGFTVPSNDGSVIRALKHSANIDAALGQGRLFVGTRKAIYALNVPVTRTAWIAADNNNQPLMTVVQLNNGWVNDRSVVPVNGDLFYQSLEPDIRSLNQCTRFFQQWGNIPISANEQRILQFNNRALLRHSSGIYFDNRLLETALPTQAARGVVHKALVPLDFTPISSFNQQRQPNWEGMMEGLDILQMATGDFGGRERSFMTVIGAGTQNIDLWEMTSDNRFDADTEDTEKRIAWIVEFPSFTWGDETLLKRLVGAELWVDRLFGTVQFVMEYRPDGQQCWIPWHAWKKCTTKHSEENVLTPQQYPLDDCLDSYVANMTLPKPPSKCTPMGRNSDIAFQFQVRMAIKGYCRIRGLYLHATPFGRKLYTNITC